MIKLKDIAYVLRSKNAGPFFFTIDIIFEKESEYMQVLKSGIINKKKIAALYKCDFKDVQIYPYPQAYAIKISFPRKASSGDINDTDLFGAQHHVPIMELPIQM